MSEAFDREGLMDRVDGDLEFLEETLEMFEEDAPDLMQAIRDATDAESLARSAHTMKGMLSNFCADEATGLALAIEQRGRGGASAPEPGALDALDTAVDRLRTELRTFLSEATP